MIRQAAIISIGASAVLGAILGLTGCFGGPILGPLSADATRVAAAPAEVYARIARGAMTCWFGGRGALAKSHIFHAEVDPPWRGGRAHIVIHERAADPDHPWGLRAFQVDLTQDSEHTAIAIENFHMPVLFEQRMREDILQWAAGTAECSSLGPSPAPSPGASPGAGRTAPRAGKLSRDRAAGQ